MIITEPCPHGLIHAGMDFSKTPKTDFREEAEEEAASLAMEVEDLQEELGEVGRLLLRARGKIGEEEKAELGQLVGEVGRGAEMIDTDASVSLVGGLGKKKGGR